MWKVVLSELISSVVLRKTGASPTSSSSPIATVEFHHWVSISICSFVAFARPQLFHARVFGKSLEVFSYTGFGDFVNVSVF